MIRSYLVLAATGAALMAAASAAGLATASSWRGMHRAASIAAVAIVLAVHVTAYAYLATAERRAAAVSRSCRLPDWLVAQASRNRGRASRFIVGGGVVMAVAAGFGLAVDVRGPAYAAWHLAASSFAMGFNAVAFLVVFVGLASQKRLLGDLWSRAAGRGEGPSAEASVAEASA